MSSSEIAKRFFNKKRSKDFREAKAATGGGKRASDLGLGTYWVKLDKVHMKETSKSGTILFEILGTVIAVRSEDCEHRVGDAVQKAFFPSSNFFYKDVKSFLASTLDVPGDEVTEENILEVCDDDNPLADMVIEVKGVGKPGKEGSKHEGKVFTNIYWNGEVALEALADLDERVKATYLPFLEEALAAE